MELFADGDYVYGISKPTIAAAIKAAVLQLIERENNI
jgi:hypothetical protein